MGKIFVKEIFSLFDEECFCVLYSDRTQCRSDQFFLNVKLQYNAGKLFVFRNGLRDCAQNLIYQ